MEETRDRRHSETLKRQLLINISEVLAEKGLLSNEEKNRMKGLIIRREG